VKRDNNCSFKGAERDIFLSIIFVTHGDRIEVATRLLRSLLPYSTENWIEFICIDNGSSPSVSELINKHYTFIHTITNKENRGTSRAYNAGIKKAVGKYLLILNDDTVIPQGMLYNLRNFLYNKPDFDGIALGLKKDNDEYQALRLKIINLKKSHPAKIQRATFTGTGNLVIKKSVMERIGLYDENYFAGNEDMDLSIRLKKAGFKIFYVPQLFIYHLHIYREKKSRWTEFILARRLSDIYFARKFFPCLVVFVRWYTLRDIKKRIGDGIDNSIYLMIKKIVKLKLNSYYEVQKSLLTNGIEKTYKDFVKDSI